MFILFHQQDGLPAWGCWPGKLSTGVSAATTGTGTAFEAAVHQLGGVLAPTLGRKLPREFSGDHPFQGLFPKARRVRGGWISLEDKCMNEGPAPYLLPVGRTRSLLLAVG